MATAKELFEPDLHLIFLGALLAARRVLCERQDSFVLLPPKAGGEVVLDVDKEAEQALLSALEYDIPSSWGVISEERGVVVTCANLAHEIYITIDPLCGSKAYSRRQRYGIAVAISVVMDGVVIAAYACDAHSGNVYYCHPHMEGVNRIFPIGFEQADTVGKPLVIDTSKPLGGQPAVLRAHTWEFPPLLADLLGQSGVFGRVAPKVLPDVSIILTMAELWDGLCVAHLLLGGKKLDSWDECPGVAFGERLGFVWLRPTEDGGAFEEFDPVIPPFGERGWRPYPAIVIHRDYVPALATAIET
jgi:hypothetical protein